MSVFIVAGEKKDMNQFETGYQIAYIISWEAKIGDCGTGNSAMNHPEVNCSRRDATVTWGPNTDCGRNPVNGRLYILLSWRSSTPPLDGSAITIIEMVLTQRFHLDFMIFWFKIHHRSIWLAKRRPHIYTLAEREPRNTTIWLPWQEFTKKELP